MLDALTITEAEAAGLSELAALDLAMARDFAARARAAEDPEVASQSPPPPVPPTPRDEARIEARIVEVRGPLHRVIWAEHEPAEGADPDDDVSGHYFDLLEERLEVYCRDNRFGLEPLDAHVVSLCRAMALDVSLARRWRELPDPPDAAFLHPDDDSAWRGSG